MCKDRVASPCSRGEWPKEQVYIIYMSLFRNSSHFEGSNHLEKQVAG